MKKFILLALSLIVISACSKKDPNRAENNTMLPDKVAGDLKSFEQTQDIEASESGDSGARESLLALAENEDSGLYINEEFNFEFVKPEGWEQQNNQAGTLVAFVAPEQEGGAFRPNINVVIQFLTQELSRMSLDEYISMSMKEIEPYFESIETKKDENSQFLGVDSKLVETEVVTEGKTLKLAQKIWFQDGKVNVITYTTDVDQFDGNLDAFNTVQNTFRFRDQ